MEKVDSVIIGAGVVGLALADALADGKRQIVVLERNDAFGRETSSRNSEVVHAGFYYPAASLKAKLCVRGNPLMYEFCRRAGVAHRRCGKLVVARTNDDEKKINGLFRQGMENGVPGLELIDRKRIIELEPHISGNSALWSPSTGILDTHGLMKKLEQRATENGATIACNCEAEAIAWTGTHYEVTVKDADGFPMTIGAETVINAAGLSSDAIALLAGIDIASAGYRISYCKGEYFSVSGRHRGKVNHLVYPAPTQVSLGVHGVLGLDNSFKLGPSAVYVDAINYDVDPSHRREFFESGLTLFPFIEEGDLSPDMAGVRPKLQTAGGPFRDFVIRDEADKGLPGFINLIGIESPGLTSALSIAEYVKTIMLSR